MTSKKTVVCVSGNFDPCHSGHASYLKEALKLGDKLIVILTRDEQVIAKKGYCFMPYEERKAIVEAIVGEGTVVINIDGLDPDSRVFESAKKPIKKDFTSCESLRHYKPDIFAKGGDTWDIKNLPEREVCEELGIKVVFGIGGFAKTQSSSELIRRVIEGYEK